MSGGVTPLGEGGGGNGGGDADSCGGPNAALGGTAAGGALTGASGLSRPGGGPRGPDPQTQARMMKMQMHLGFFIIGLKMVSYRM